MAREEKVQPEPTEEDWSDLTTMIHTWDEEGQALEGVLERTEPFTDGKFETDVICYVFKTAAGLVSTVLGSATDKQLATKVKPGDILRITFQGKKELADGRQVNLFQVRKRKHA